MRRSHSGHLPGVLPLIMLLITTIGCASLANTPTSLAPAGTPTGTSTPAATLPPANRIATPLSGAQATATPTPLAGGGASGGLGGGSGGGGSSGSGGGSSGGGGGGGASGGGGGSGSGGAGGASGSGGYVVKQIETLGGEVISGFVCSLTAPFGVNSKTPKVAFVFSFVPQDATHGQVSYAYSISSAGEAHSATGTYTVSPAGADGTLLVSLTVSDHVTFKGFDGNIPNHYKFDLVPAGTAPCP